MIAYSIPRIATIGVVFAAASVVAAQSIAPGVRSDPVDIVRNVAADASSLYIPIDHNFDRQSVQRLIQAWEQQTPPSLRDLQANPNSIAVWVLCLGINSDPDKVAQVLPLLNDRTTKLTLTFYESGRRARVDMRDWVRSILSYRTGLPMSSRFLLTEEAARTKWPRLCARGQPVDWGFRFRKSLLLGEDVAPLWEELQASRAGDRAVALAWIAASVPGAVPLHELRKHIADAVGLDGIRRILEHPDEGLRVLLDTADEDYVRKFRSVLVSSLRDVVTNQDIKWMKTLVFDAQKRIDWLAFDVMHTALRDECRPWLQVQYNRELVWLSGVMKTLSATISSATTYRDFVSSSHIETLVGLSRYVEYVNQEPLRRLGARPLGIVALAAGMSDDYEAAVPVLLALAANDETTIPVAWEIPGHGRLASKEQAVKDVVRRVLEDRGVQFHDSVEGAVRQYHEFSKTPLGQAAEWLYRFRKEGMIGGGDGVLDEITSLPRAEQALAVVAIAAWRPSSCSKEAIARAVKGMDREAIRAALTDGAIWAAAPRYFRVQLKGEMRRLIAEYAITNLSREDAEWLRQPAMLVTEIPIYRIVLASRLNPEEGEEWLKDGIEKHGVQIARCKLVEALWSVGGERQISYLKDRYFADSKPEYNAGGLQENLIERLAKNQGAKAAPLLKALVLDRRFSTLGWAATRAFAKNASLILGEETKEVKRYLGVEHRMGVYGFEHRPEQRDKYLVDTKHVRMQTEAFQIYLQGEVLKRSRGDNAK